MTRKLAQLAVVLPVILFAASARAGADLDRVAELIASADVDRAEREVQAAMRKGELTRAELAKAHLFLGLVAAARRKNELADASFRRALRLDGAISLPSGQAPSVEASFRRAVDAVRGEPALEVAVDAAVQANGLRVTVVVSGDPEASAKRARATEDGRASVDVVLDGGRGAAVVPFGADGCVNAKVVVVDADGNLLVPSAQPVRGCQEKVAPPVAVSPRVAQRPSTAFWLVAAGAGIAGVATGVLGVRALDQRSQYHDANHDPSRVAERSPLRDDAARAQRTATVAGVAFGVLATASVALFVWDRRAVQVDARATSLAVSGSF